GPGGADGPLLPSGDPAQIGLEREEAEPEGLEQLRRRAPGRPDPHVGGGGEAPPSPAGGGAEAPLGNEPARVMEALRGRPSARDSNARQHDRPDPQRGG